MKKNKLKKLTKEQKLKLKIKELSSNLDYQISQKESYRDEIEEKNAEIEVYKEIENTLRREDREYKRRLEDQVYWLRSLVEAATLSPESLSIKLQHEEKVKTEIGRKRVEGF